jgi:imidazolonepropionase-like amidohydrolase
MLETMDRPLKKPRNTPLARLRREIALGVKLLAVVFGVAALPVLFVYVGSKMEAQRARSLQSDSGFQAGIVSTVSAKETKLIPLSSETVAFVNVNIVPMDREQILNEQTVIVKDGRIVEIGLAESVKVPAGARRIEGRGQYLMPGLADMHVHLKDYAEHDNLAMLRLYVANGVTTVLNLHGTPQHLELREKIAKGEALGPVLYTSGPFISDAPVSTPTPEEAVQGVVEQKRAGYDFIKIHGDFSADAYHRLFVAARREGMRVIGHAPRTLGVEPMLEERQDAVAHSEEYLYAYFFKDIENNKAIMSADRETQKRYIAEQASRIPQLAQATAKAGSWVIANLTAYKNIALQLDDFDAVMRRPEMKYMVPDIAPWWLPEQNTYKRRFKPEMAWRFHAQYEILEKLTKGFQQAGVRLLAGTDALNPCVVPGFSLHDELQYLVAAGLTPYEAIRTATTNVAEFLGVGNEVGTVSVGKRADLILLDGDPLKDVTNTAKRIGVMIRGRWLPEAEIQKMLGNLALR